MVGAERFEALLTLVGLDFPSETSLEFPCVHLHGVFVHEYLEQVKMLLEGVSKWLEKGYLYSLLGLHFIVTVLLFD